MKQQGQYLLFTRGEFKGWFMQQHISRAINMIQNHHTWSPSYSGFNGSNHFERLESMKDFHVRSRGFSDIAQNLTTFPDGTIAVCRPLNIAPAGIKGANANGICIEHFGNFDIDGDIMTDEHYKTILFVNAVLCEKFKLPINTESIVYHHWWSAGGSMVFDLKTGKKLPGAPAKSCPGTAFFGGNTVLDAKTKFIPLIAALNNNNGEDEEKLKLTTSQQTMLVDALQDLNKQGKFSDKTWIEKAKNGTLTLSELAWLNTIVAARK